MILKKVSLLIIFIIAFLFSFCQQPSSSTSVYNSKELFAQNFYTKNGNEFRAANGAQGSKYWQNRADYLLHAVIDTVKNELICDETISYTKNSPGSLQSLGLELDQNTYREDERSNFY